MPSLPKKQPGEVIVLIAEDDLDDRDILCEVIQESNRNVVALFVHDGAELLQCLKELAMTKPVRFPDLVVLDVNMPRLNGKEALRLMKSSPETKELPAVMLTTSTDPKLKEELLQLGACGFYTKPTRLMDFRKIIHTMLDECLIRNTGGHDR